MKKDKKKKELLKNSVAGCGGAWNAWAELTLDVGEGDQWLELGDCGKARLVRVYKGFR